MKSRKTGEMGMKSGVWLVVVFQCWLPGCDKHTMVTSDVHTCQMAVGCVGALGAVSYNVPLNPQQSPNKTSVKK